MRENKLGTWPIPKLLVNMSVPMMISFFIQALYNIVDSMFVAQISENALTAVSLAFPMQQVANAIAVGIGVGMSALVPHYIGLKNEKRANQVAHTGIFLNICFAGLFIVLGALFAQKIYLVQTNVPEIVQGGTIYLRIVWCVGIGVFFCQYFEKMLVCTGNPLLAMISQASGALFNIVFDPLLIFGIGPFPQWGIAGAAIATVGGQLFSTCIGFLMNHHKNHWIHFQWSLIRFQPDVAKEIFRVGIPSMVTIGLNSATSFCVNMIILSYSTTATAVYGIWLKLQNFCCMPLFGLNNGMIPILSYNLAQDKKDRVKQTSQLAFRFALVLMVCVMIILEAFPQPFLQMYNASNHMLDIGIVALRICVASLPFASISLIRSTAMQALEHARYTLIVNILRQFLIIVPAFYLLSTLFHQLQYIWWAVPITEVICAYISIYYYRKMEKNLQL